MSGVTTLGRKSSESGAAHVIIESFVVMGPGLGLVSAKVDAAVVGFECKGNCKGSEILQHLTVFVVRFIIYWC